MAEDIWADWYLTREGSIALMVKWSQKGVKRRAIVDTADFLSIHFAANHLSSETVQGYYLHYVMNLYDGAYNFPQSVRTVLNVTVENDANFTKEAFSQVGDACRCQEIFLMGPSTTQTYLGVAGKREKSRVELTSGSQRAKFQNRFCGLVNIEKSNLAEKTIAKNVSSSNAYLQTSALWGMLSSDYRSCTLYYNTRKPNAFKIYKSINNSMFHFSN